MQHNALSDTLRTDDGRPLSPIAPGTPHSQDDQKNRSMRQLRNVAEDLQTKRNREKEERLQRSIQATLKKLSRKVDKSVLLTDNQAPQRQAGEPDGDRSPGASPKRARPPKPNKFWKDSMQKVSKQEPSDKLPQNRRGDTDEPRATRFPELEDFLNKSPEDPNHLDGSPSEGKKSYSPTLELDKSQSRELKKSPRSSGDFRKQFEENFNQKPRAQEDLTNPEVTHHWNEEDNNKSEVMLMPLDRAQDESMEFDEGDDDDRTDRDMIQCQPPKANAAAIGQNDGLTVSMENLLGGADHGKPPTGKKAVPVDDRPTIKSPEHQLLKRPSRGSRRRDSKRPHDIQSNEQYSEALFEFFKSLDYDPNKANQGTVRASYRSGRASYNLYGVPAKKPGEKSQVFVQSQDGFDRDLPPVRLSGEQTAQLVHQFKELDALESNRQSVEEEAPDEDFLTKNNVNQNPLKNDQELDFSLLESKQSKFERKTPTPSKDKHVRAADGVQRNNKTFWSSGYERSIPNQPKASQIQKKGMPGASLSKAGNFQSEFDKTMNTQSIPSDQNKDANTSADDPNNSRAGISFKNIVYNVGSSVFGGFGSFSQSSRDKGQGDYQPKVDERAAEPKTRSNIDQPPVNYVLPEQTQRSKTPGGRGMSPSRRPHYSRFQHQGQPTPQQIQGSHQQPPPADPRAPATKSPSRLVYSPPHERTKAYPQQVGRQDPHQNAGAQPDGPYSERQRPQEVGEASVKSARSYRSPSRRSQDSRSRSRGRVSPGRVHQDPVVLKLAPEDINDQRKESQEPQYQQPFKGNPKDYKPPQVFMNNLEHPKEKPAPVPRSVVEEYMEQEPLGRHQIDSNYQQVQSDVDLNLPNVILLVADNVRLIRNNSVPLLQVQVEIIQNALNIDNDMCMLGLNDVIYIVPEFTPAEYDAVYSRLCTGNEFEEFGPFFEHYRNFRYNDSPMIDNIPERLMGLHKNSMTAIERDHYEPDLRGKAFINLKHVPNGHYTIFHLRIGQPISINSRLKVLGRAKGNFVNINREKISLCKKPQLDLNHSSSRISRRETSKFKIMKAKNNKKRDNKVMCLNSDDEDEDEETVTPQEKKIDEDFKRMFKADAESKGEDSKYQKDNGLEMEFDDGGEKEKTEKSRKSVMQPPPMQDSKDYYNSTQRMTEAMIQNPQFQLFSIDEEESVRTSMRESEDDRKKKNVGDEYGQGVRVRGNRGYADKSLDATPNAGTPPDDAPEDAFRNIHRQVDLSQSLEPIQTQTHISDASVDPISKQIEDYQRESLAQLANLSLQPTPEPRPQHAAPPKVERPSPVRDYVPPQQRERRDSVHSRGSARSRQSARSNDSRGSRRSTRVKTISLRDLEGEPPAQHGRDGRPNAHVRAAPRQRSRSLSNAQEQERDTLQHPQYPPRQRSPAQAASPSKEQADDPFVASMRETTKLEIINLNQKRPLQQPSIQRQQDMVALYGRKEDRTMQATPAPANPALYQMQDRVYHPPNNAGDPNRSRSPMTNGQMGRPQDRYQHPGQVANLRSGPAGGTHARQPSGSRPWRRDRSRGRSDVLRSNDGSPSRKQAMHQPDLVQQPPYQARASPARELLKYDRLGNPIGQRTPVPGLDRPKSAAEDPTNPQNTSMRSNSRQRRPGSASQLQNSRDQRDQSRNRFFSPQARSKGSHHSRSLSQGRAVEQRPVALFSPSQLLNGGHNPSTSQMMPNGSRQPQNQASRSPLRQQFSQPMRPADPRNNRNSSRFSDENFSDENHSPVRPIGQMNMQQSVPLRQQHHGMKQRFGNSITGSVTNASVPAPGGVGGFNKYGNAQPLKSSQRAQRQPRF